MLWLWVWHAFYHKQASARYGAACAAGVFTGPARLPYTGRAVGKRLRFFIRMIRAARILIIAFLSLTQLVGPLVHAHSGDTRSPGLVHLPGLESLARQSDTHMQLPALDTGGQDVVVGLGPALLSDQDAAHTSNTPKPADLVPVLTWFSARGGPSDTGPPPTGLVRPPDHAYPAASPRAPPA